jgi:hypothetical protein
MRYAAVAIAPVVLMLVAGVPAEAQFSSDIPGVPRAATPFAGGRQVRTEYDFSFHRFGGAPGDTLMVAGRVGFGRSWRIRSDWEVGYDLSLLEGAHAQSPDDESGGNVAVVHYTRGVLLHGVRIGAKYRPISSITPEGYGYHVALGVALQPAIKPAFAVTHGDTTLLGGAFVGSDSPIVGPVPQALQFAVMGSYRARRVTADAALLLEKSEAGSVSDGPSPVAIYDGISLRLGATFRATPSLALGGTFWGQGAPPWRDRVVLRGPTEDRNVGLLVSFGSRPEAGTDLILSSPTGSLTKSVRLYIRTRSTL